MRAPEHFLETESVLRFCVEGQTKRLLQKNMTVEWLLRHVDDAADDDDDNDHHDDVGDDDCAVSDCE